MSEWISVKDQLPHPQQTVVCIGDLDFFDDGVLHGAFVCEFEVSQCLVAHEDGWDYEKEGCIRRRFKKIIEKKKNGYSVKNVTNVTHWMPLPALLQISDDTISENDQK